MNQVETESLSVVSLSLVAERQLVLQLSSVSSVLQRSYTRPGQYAMLQLHDGKAQPFAIASPAGSQDNFEFLIKWPAERVQELLACPPSAVRCSSAMGKGFPLEEARGRSLWLVCVGSGISAIRPVVEQIVRERHAYRDVHLLYGVRTARDLCFTGRFAGWRAADIEVTPILSRACDASWSGSTGYVQDHLPDAFPDPAQIVAFLCGLPVMDKDVVDALGRREVKAERVFRNW